MSGKLCVVHRRLIGVRSSLLVILFVITGIIISIIINSFFLLIVKNYEELKGKPAFGNHSILWVSIMGLVVAPITETLCFQYLVFEGLKRWFVKRKVIPVIISASFFALSHFYSGYYIIEAFFSGLIFSYAYLVFSDKQVFAFGYVSIIHALRNVLPFVLFSLNKI